MNDGPESATVLRCFKRVAPIVLDLVIEADGTTCTITTTPEHPFYVPSLGDYMAANDLELGTRFLGSAGTTAHFVEASIRTEATTVYNVEVEGAHNYFVGLPGYGDGILVHNVCRGHHTIPTQVLDEVPAGIRNGVVSRARGGNNIIWDVPDTVHAQLHGAVGRGYGRGGAYNVRFRAEVHAKGGYRSVTVDDLFEIRERLVREFDIVKYRPRK